MRRRAMLATGVAAVALWLPAASAATGGTGAPGPGVPVSWQRTAVADGDLAGRIGVRLVRVSVSGAGGLIDLRYQVVDPARAAAVHAAATPPAIVDERTGLVLAQLLMDHAHSGPLKPAVTYYLLFDNPGGWVHRGATVTVLLGDAQVEHVVVA